MICDEDDMLFVYISDFEDENDGDDGVSWIIVDFVEECVCEVCFIVEYGFS